MRESNIDSSSDGQNWFDRHQRLIIMKREVLVSNILDSEDVQLVAQDDLQFTNVILINIYVR